MLSKLKKRLTDQLFVLALIALGFWIANAYLKIFILHAPERMLWYSSSGLALITIGLFTRNSFLLTAMFCALIIPESIWSVSFLSKLFFNTDIFGMVTPIFDSNFPFYQFVISMYHLTIVPSLIVGLTSVRRVHSFGWLGAFVFAITLGILSQIFSDPSENINCVLQEVGGSCKLFFSYFYQFDNSFSRIILGGSIIALLVYLPLNYGLLVLAKRLGWQKIGDTNIKNYKTRD